jgi:hypothetical protein
MKFSPRIFVFTILSFFMVPIGLLAQPKTIERQDASKKVATKNTTDKKVRAKPAKVDMLATAQQPKLAGKQIMPLADTLKTAPIKPKVAVENNNFALYTTDAGTIADDDLMILKAVDFSQTDYLFYLLVGMFLLLGMVRTAFPKYFNDLFALFFQSTFKQKSIREQLSQTALPSLLLNILFFFSAGFFLYILTGYYQLHVAQTFEGNLGIWILVLILVYVSKLLLIRLLGWIFQLQEATQSYNFIVFMMNKVMGVALLPFLLLLCFGPANWRPVVITLSFFLIAAMLTYRYIIAYPAVRPTVRLNRFHFFIYLCTFEIIPFALIYKELTAQFLQKT